MIKLKEIIKRYKGEKSAFQSNKVLECNEIILKFNMDITDDYSDELLLKYAEEYDKQYIINEDDYIYVFLYIKGRKNTNGWKPYYYLATGIQCKKQNGKLVITEGYRG